MRCFIVKPWNGVNRLTQRVWKNIARDKRASLFRATVVDVESFSTLTPGSCRTGWFSIIVWGTKVTSSRRCGAMTVHQLGILPAWHFVIFNLKKNLAFPGLYFWFIFKQFSCHIRISDDILNLGTLQYPELPEWLTLPKGTEGGSPLSVCTSVLG